MLLTEQEAKGRWCPMTRVVQNDAHDYPVTNGNRNMPDPVAAGCIASNCMMWRWLDRLRDGTVLHTKWEGYGGNEYRLTDDQSERRGYCGLARRPETA